MRALNPAAFCRDQCMTFHELAQGKWTVSLIKESDWQGGYGGKVRGQRDCRNCKTGGNIGQGAQTRKAGVTD